MPVAQVRRALPIGAEPRRSETHFRVWAPRRRRVEVALERPGTGPALFPLAAEGGGYFSGMAPGVAGDRYWYQLDADEALRFPDPASRFQPDGPHGPSEIVSPRYVWTDREWTGLRPEGQVLYEMHIGTFTPEGTWRAAAAQLEELAALGVTAVEIMPVADFPGRFGWGYDGVNLFAPTWLYGRPEAFRQFVDRAHGVGLGVILDVVYNHLGPDGNYLAQYAREYFSERYKTDWGEAINFDGEGSGPVREFFLANAAYWIREFHLDGLRLDATQDIHDASERPILGELTRTAREAARGRGVLIVGENEPQDTRLLRPVKEGGLGCDALWNDDFHHSAMVALTGRSEAYYTDYRGTAQELISCARHGFLYQGQWYHWQEKRRGTPTRGLPRRAFVHFIQNHDQIANSTRGQRITENAGPGALRAMTALLLLMPGTPMLFQGQEFGASAPFRYFSDHRPEIARLVLAGRAEFLSQFPSLSRLETQALLADPGNPSTFEACKLDFAERERNRNLYALHRELLRLRREETVLAAPGAGDLEGAVLRDDVLALRFLGDEAEGDRLLVVNLGHDLPLEPVPEPLLAPPAGCQWALQFSSEDPRFGGLGVYEPEQEGRWRIPGQAAVLVRPVVRGTGGETSAGL